MKMTLLAATAAACLVAMAAPANAALYNFTFTASTISGSGVFTTSDTASSGGGYLITATTGSVTAGGNSFAITGPNTYAGADNLLFPNSTPYLDFDGTSFAIASNGNVNLYYSGGYKYIRSTNSTVAALTSFTVTPAAGAVPEPTTWAMMLGGFGIVGFSLRRRGERALQAV